MADLGILINTELPQFDIDQLTTQRRFRTYLRVPAYVDKYLSRFGVPHDSQGLKEILTLFYFWLKVVDDEIDQGKLDGRVILERFGHASYEPTSKQLPIALTDLLREGTLGRHDDVFTRLKELYGAANMEKSAGNMRELIEARKSLGRQVALTTVELASPHIAFRNPAFEKFFVEIGEATNIYDLSLDWKEDFKNGNLNFRPSHRDALFLYATAAGHLAKILIKYPFIVTDSLKHMPYHTNNNILNNQHA